MNNSNQTILIVDDNIDTVELLRKRLKAEGYNTEEAYDGEEALKKVYEVYPDLIILDVMMPKMDGYEVCQRLKTDDRTKFIPIIMLTAKSDVESKVKGFDIGADDYVPKPFDYRELSARVRSLITRKETAEKVIEEEKTESVRKLIDSLSHEIRNPIVSIAGFTKKVYDNLPPGDPNKPYLMTILQEAERLERLLKEILNLKMIAIGFLENVNPKIAIEEILEELEKEIEDKAIEVETDFKDVPSFYIDKEHFKIVLRNIIKNAIEAMEKSEKRLLKISLEQVKNEIEIRISDTGKGIPKELIKKIFDPFFTSKVYGPGLGLSVALTIVQYYKGFISVESEPGKGSTFIIRIPVKGR
ncbi:response regulator [Thermodesulfovibrio yellowstonii]|uniref:histidine kinase n=1 Tax=Thermodesulfovibrio yellowstonii (strain ATCC 51303 / DSM 11347 / YP87) TaxID=289376 RepID=B5YFU9_THEYD|nr:response regulator [Thermodesulfovibrio yellowstonii]ACI22151.1 two-component hybrid sensor and regulator [Thermodesulfovibrio yellowstonii DSM 11347]